MEKTKLTFIPSKRWKNQLSDITNLLLVIRDYKDEYGIPPWLNYDGFIDSVNATKNECDGMIEDFINEIRPYFGQHLLMTFSYKTDNEEWIVEKQIVIMPYQYIPINNCLFGLIAELNNSYKSGIEDTSIDLSDIIPNKKIEIEVITKEMFWEYVIDSVHNVYDERIGKTKNENYILTENGWKHK